MSSAVSADTGIVSGRLDADGRLIEADPPLAALQAQAGGSSGGTLAVPQIAALARLAQRLGITVSRAAVAASGEEDLDLWVRAEPEGREIALAITGWTTRPARPSAAGPTREREADFLRAAADWTWETDDRLRLTALSPGAGAAIGSPPSTFLGKQLTRLFRFLENPDGSLPILTALAEHRSFDAQAAELRAGRQGRFLLSGVPLIDGSGNFAGFRGGAVAQSEEAAQSEAEARVMAREGTAFGERLDQALRGPLAHIIDNAERLRAQPEGPLRRDYAGYAEDIASA